MQTNRFPFLEMQNEATLDKSIKIDPIRFGHL